MCFETERAIQLFFWFFPPGPQGSLDDLVMWYVPFSLRLFVLYHSKLVDTGSTVVPGVRQWKVSSRRMGCVA